ncbi:MAG: DEAD/DEAH box helicase [Actinobacteria bacterium]|nr:DEAD/DEAH box helicase [Actinomycetota bacterium]
MTSPLDRFWDSLPFGPDDFQVDAATAVEEGQSVVVTAPTGSGKTLVAEAAIHLALSEGTRAFYTTPIKALSNQKFADLADAYGPERVGLLTGDNVINGDADIVVMTTEVLRNMIYAESRRLDRVSTVILDEVHYLQDRTRGAIWEEVIIHCPQHVRLVCLSATVSNNVEFASWVRERRGPTRLVATDHRPVPLESLYMIKDKMGAQTLHLLPTFTRKEGSRRSNPRIQNMMGPERGRRRRFKTPNRVDVIERLDEEGLLPAIYFIFSRAGCDAATHRLAETGLRLTDSAERSAIRKIAEMRTDHLTGEDLDVLGYDDWVSALEMGVGAHHAGLVPAFKETVEVLFESGLLSVVFATETLALGINMPAKTVVLESLSKFNGETHEPLRPGDYTQLTGRAGRRGIDVEGFGVVLHSPFVRFSTVTEIAASGSHPLRSSFRPTYNMTANLVANYGLADSEKLLEASFASFQREEDRHEVSADLRQMEERLDAERARAECDRGSIEEYLAILESTQPPTRDDRIASTLKPGQVLDITGGARDGRYAVLKRLSHKDGGVRYLVLSTSGRVSTIGNREILHGTKIAGQIDLPGQVRPRDRRFLQETRRRLRRLPVAPTTKTRGSNKGISHPVAECPDAARHVEAARKAERTRRKVEQLRSVIRARGHGLIEEFRAIRALLEELDYLDGWSLTNRGERLRTIYNESDLLVTEALEHGIFHGLDAMELAALSSVFVYEPRSDTASVAEWPTAALTDQWNDLESLWKDLFERERRLRLTPTRRPDPGFGMLAYQWVSGTSFDDLSTRGMAPGDFVRVSRQLVDLLRQLREIAPELAEEARGALQLVDRGVVAAQGVG